jgi:hypothetical protein
VSISGGTAVWRDPAKRITDGAALMALQVVHDDDVAGPQRRHEHVYHIDQKAVAVDRAIEQPWCLDPVRR